MAPWLLSAIPAALGGLANFFGSKTQADASNVANERTIAANRELANFQFSKDLEMWNLGNKYNSPEAQMERLKAAGLNPNLVYGSGSAAGMAAGQLPKYNAPTVRYETQVPQADFASMIGQYQDMQVKQAQVDNLRAQRAVIEQSELGKMFANQLNIQTRDDLVKKRQGEAELTWDKSFLADQAFSQRLEMFPYQLQYAQGRNRAQDAQINKILQDTELTKLKSDYFVGQAIAGMGTSILGLFNRMFKGGAKGAGQLPLKLNQKMQAPWRSTIKTNPMKEMGRTVPSRRVQFDKAAHADFMRHGGPYGLR